MLKWHGNEEQTNIVVYHLQQSCGVHTVSYLKTEVILKLILWHQHSYLDLKVSVFPFPNGPSSMIKVHTSFGWEIHLDSWKNSFDAFLLWNSLPLKEKLPRDLGSPGNHQLLLPQLFSPNLLLFKFWAPPHHLCLVWSLNSWASWAYLIFVSLWRWMSASLCMPCSVSVWVVDVWFTGR